ncbi:putative Ribosomal protein S6 kinase alpha-6 [Blattamonas nauphoetae]|uniref:non-specific serine/threonine protein kinase n=1 Tax=Blattamonas nauphoetae TaxID=2049346 RepID=A0ABQ9XFB9_9EUKA|nr:putative Ribosomal protein S6 kinase alpha-6 [Blattamonas nauphoetae]
MDCSMADFEIIKPITRGAFGRVFLVKLRNRNKASPTICPSELYAMKVLHRSGITQSKIQKRLILEYEILENLSHDKNDFIVNLVSSFQTQSNFYLIMQFQAGGDLYSFLTAMGYFSEEVAKQYLCEIVLAVEFLHAHNIVHCDLKPDNLLIGADGHLRLTDFGMSFEAIFHIRGTPDYIAPEIIQASPYSTTFSVDWWAVGIIFFEMLSGSTPFNASTRDDVFDNILDQDIDTIMAGVLPEDVSDDARSLIRGLLEKNPENRLGTKHGVSEIKNHPYFADVDWDNVYHTEPVFSPSFDGETTTQYFDPRDERFPVKLIDTDDVNEDILNARKERALKHFDESSLKLNIPSPLSSEETSPILRPRAKISLTEPTLPFPLLPSADNKLDGPTQLIPQIGSIQGYMTREELTSLQQRNDTSPPSSDTGNVTHSGDHDRPYETSLRQSPNPDLFAYVPAHRDTLVHRRSNSDLSAAFPHFSQRT